MLNFVDGADLTVSNLVVVIYGQPNVGKTSLALTASKPVMMDFDGGAYRAGNKSGKSVVPVEKWDDVARIDADDIADFDTIVIDTVGTALDALIADIIRVEPKHNRGGALTLQGYGVLKTRFKGWLDQMRVFGKDVVLVAHASEEQRGDDTVDRIVAAGGSKQEVYQQADLMGRISIVGGKRVLSFDPTAVSYGKNVGLPDFTIKPPATEPDALAKIIATAKESLNAKAKAGQDEHDRLMKLRESLTKVVVDVDAANSCMEEMVADKAGPADKKLLLEVCEAAGLKFDRKAKSFVDPKPAATADASKLEAPF